MSVRYSEVSAIEYVRKSFFFGWASAYSYILYRNFLVLEVKVAAFEMNNYLFFKVNIIAEFFKVRSAIF